MADKHLDEDKYIIGIDMGTTSIKISIISLDSFRVVEEHSNTMDAYIINNDLRSEQDVKKIVQSLDSCMLSCSEKNLKKVIGIGICGQMHGVTCWSGNDLPWSEKDLFGTTFLEVDSTKISNCYTWQDSRCNPQFLSSLPTPNSHLSIHTGYGCCTLFWLTRNSPETIENFNRSGTIADFIVAMLCNSDRATISTQNAASWGYFNCEKNEWNLDVLSASKFPIHLLPEILQPNTIAGKLGYSWHNIPKGTPIGVALGDLQSYVLASLENDNQAIVNISTSAQLVYIANNFMPSKLPEKTVEKTVPYFEGKYLHEAAALNGGNAMSTFVTFLQDCLRIFGNATEQDNIWEKLIRISITDSSESELNFSPTFLGERHDPQKKGSIYNLTPDNFQLNKIFKALCEGVIRNLRSMISPEVLRKEGITKIVASGSALLRNKILQSELEKQYGLPVECKFSANSPFGAAISIARTLNSRV